ncbi:ER membrane complex subunit 2 [Komagataella phaffii CBS 7435]|uniref:ER membrane protein complex subunit 2 n=2 Tax=Komagataella phaffii TaxID=460519 RepID=C4R8V4_KOMPG|nr:uncharacterized protein PAS_chr4_0765 [Komagataella phaffii GS115]AOA64723.1 GQ67_05148T0 [Komagataella phaffii]CAH2450565.1 ER membrane complex subunit 2 [Komagataella phaffii CBS 7435]AOA70350.1 GQ68_05130T0 [Komagataella phaffii GS115]CAY72029.1 Putative protein of unknown function [Komagataella phaffii GS115]CCA40369.1 ER membrane complex subunit 2 [Komagataella phaffii CBS 7435]
MATKDRLLKLYAGGQHVTMSPEKLNDVYSLSKQFTALLTSSKNSYCSEIEYFQLMELQFYLALQTNHDVEAKKCMDIMTDRFNINESEKLIGLRALYLQATVGNEQAFQLLKQSGEIATRGSTLENTSEDLLHLKKRAVLVHQNDPPEKYVEMLLKFSEVTPLDTSVWKELADQYIKLNHYDKAINCLQEILLIQPFAYNIIALLAETELQYIKQLESELKGPGAYVIKDKLREVRISCRRHFLRSVELCSNYARGWSGVLAVTSQEISPQRDTTEVKLHHLATQRLKEIQEKKLSSDENLKYVTPILTKYQS